MKRVVYLACFLAIVSALAGGLLSFVNEITFDRINSGRLGAEIDNLVKIFPDAKFEEISFTDETGLIEKVFEADGQGYVYKINVRGYNDTITFMIGINNDAKIVGYEVLVFSDTPGIGDVVIKDDFKNSIIGKASNDGIATVSGATISSSAIINGIDAAKAHYNEMNGITGEGTLVVEEKVEIKLGTAVKLSDEILERYEGEILTEETDGNISIYQVAVNGYGLVETNGSTGEYSRNEYKIVVNRETMTLESIECIHFGDTQGIGDRTMEAAYYERFEGMSMEDYDQEVDVVSGATITSHSMINAIRIVMDTLNK